MADALRIGPQSGPQEMFLASNADIAIYGGAAGAGKTWAELLEPLRHVTTVKEFAAVFFRRTTVQIKNVGGLWDASMRLYPLTGGSPTAHVSEWHWEGGGKVKMAHLEHESTVFDWQGAEIPLILFDELTHFTQYQFFYMLSRNRSTCGVRPYVRATCNPDADSWVARFIEWWIDQETGFPIPERAGVVRYFIRINDAVIWDASIAALLELYGVRDELGALLAIDDPLQIQPKSVTFVPGKLSDNPALMRADPGYLANLKALPMVEQARLLGGNWKIRPAAGLYWKREWCEVVEAVPSGLEIVRYWDLAATEKTDANDPDWTVGIKLGKDSKTGVYYWLDARRARIGPLPVENLLENTAKSDGVAVRIGIPQDPGQAGKSQAQGFVRKLAGFAVTYRRESGDKIVRFGPFSAMCQAGNVKILKGSWNEESFTALEAFPSSAHDDDVDGCSGAYQMLTEGNTGLLEYYRNEAEKINAEKLVEQTMESPASGGSAIMQALS